ncbi:hypothetical protein VTK73DRAFT_5636 [Phialemonium thermophilum]|uniref:Uncharacterized protein n=1 Tax=Phialemonium thermophilum TaxID=223376 RepID=A0ABR3V1W2_9PEZI
MTDRSLGRRFAASSVSGETATTEGRPVAVALRRAVAMACSVSAVRAIPGECRAVTSASMPQSSRKGSGVLGGVWGKRNRQRGSASRIHTFSLGGVLPHFAHVLGHRVPVPLAACVVEQLEVLLGLGGPWLWRGSGVSRRGREHEEEKKKQRRQEEERSRARTAMVGVAPKQLGRQRDELRLGPASDFCVCIQRKGDLGWLFLFFLFFKERQAWSSSTT